MAKKKKDKTHCEHYPDSKKVRRLLDKLRGLNEEVKTLKFKLLSEVWMEREY